MMVPILALTIPPCAFAQSYWIDRVAGNPSAADDGIPAREASLARPWDVAVGMSGSFYIADWRDNRIRKVDAAGTITTVAGTGSYGFSGDGGPAVNAQLEGPRGVAADRSGNIYIADTYNHRVRKVDAAGTITTVAGTGSRGYSGDGGPAVNARLRYPCGVAVDGSGNLYIVDTDNHRVRKVDAAGTITTVAGSESSGFSGDGGPAVSARLQYPRGVAVDGVGSLYIADTRNHRIRKVDAAGIITTVAGSGRQGLQRRWRPRRQRRVEHPLQGRGRCVRQHLLHRQLEQPDSQGGRGGHHHHRRRRLGL